MLKYEYVLPYLVNMDGKLVLDRNSGYSLGKMYISEDRLYSQGFDWCDDFNRNLANGLVVDELDRGSYKFFRLYNCGFNSVVFVYKDNKIHYVSNISSYLLDLHTKYYTKSSTYANRDVVKIVSSVVKDLVYLSDGDKKLLSILMEFSGFKLLYNKKGKVVVMLSPTPTKGSKLWQKELSICYVLNSNNKKEYVLYSSGFVVYTKGKTDYYVMQDYFTSNFMFVKIGDNVRVTDLGSVIVINSTGTNILTREDYNYFRLETGDICKLYNNTYFTNVKL